MTTSRSGYDVNPLPEDRITALAAELSPEERHVILHQGTERPFCGLLLDHKQPGTYVCRLCGLPLFASDSKFHSGTGWPSFFRPYDPDHVRELERRRRHDAIAVERERREHFARERSTRRRVLRGGRGRRTLAEVLAAVGAPGHRPAFRVVQVVVVMFACSSCLFIVAFAKKRVFSLHL